MPRLLSLGIAFLLWTVAEEHPELAGEPEPVLLVATIAVAWLFGMRWAAPRDRPPPEARPLGFFLLPFLNYLAWLLPCGGVRLWQDWDLPAVFSAWIGLVPWFLIQAGYRYGEGACLGLGPAGARRFAWRQTRALLLVVVPVALAAQGWESGLALLPEDPETWSSGQQLWAWAVELGVPVLVLPVILALLPTLLGAAGPLPPAWQEVAARAWRPRRGRPPRVLDWPTQGLFANALAAGFGPWKRILVTDRLQGLLREQELAAVLAHEVAHLRRGHTWTLLAGVLGGALLGTTAVDLLWAGAGPAPLLPSVLGLALGIAPLVPASRAFEMEADLDAMAGDPAHPAGLTGALTLLAPVGRASWLAVLGLRHLPPAERLRELDLCLADPAREAWWRARARRWRRLMRALLPAGLALFLAGPAGPLQVGF